MSILDFPANPTAGQVFNPGTGAIYTFDGVAWNLSPVNVKTADNDNLVVNGSMWLSQENGTTAQTTHNSYPADQWGIGMSHGGAISFQQVSSPAGSKGKSPTRIKATVTTADAAVAAGDYCQLFTRIEGIRCGDLKWGTADAVQIVCNFGFKGPAGTYGVSFRNNSGARVYVASFTIAAADANTETFQTIVVPGDITGTWTAAEVLYLQVSICLMTGTTYQGAVGVWGGTNYLGPATQFNFLGTVGNVMELFDFGVYVDPLNTGIAPSYNLPSYDDELAACRRYYQSYSGMLLFTSYSPAGSQYLMVYSWQEEMRVNPTIALGNSGGSNSSSPTVNGTGRNYYNIQANATAAGAAYMGFSITANSRM